MQDIDGRNILKIRHGRTAAGRLLVTLSEVDVGEPDVDQIDLATLADEVGVFELAETLSQYGVRLEQMYEDALGVLPTQELAADGNDYGNGRGVVSNKDTKRIYQPFSARGNVNGHGLYEQLWREEIQIQRPWADVLDALTSGDWFVDAPDLERQYQARFVEDALFNIQGGWSKFITNAMYAPIAGFSLFEEVFCPTTFMIDKLAFRYPKQVQGWVKTSDDRHLVAARLRSPGANPDIYVPAHHLLLISWNAFGDDYEGNSPLRPIAKYAAAKDMFARLEALAGEKYGSAILVLSSDKGVASSQGDLINEILAQMTAEDQVVIELPDGRTLELISPDGMMPDFGPIKQYCDQQIAMALRGEGSLLGQNGTGSYALASVSDDKSLRAVPAYAQRICDALNGSRNTPYQGTVRKMIDARFGRPSDGRYPMLRFSLNANAKSATWLADVGAAKRDGLIEWTPDDEAMVREHLGLPSVEEVSGD